MNRIGISSFVAGLVFALGLGLSGMTQPQKIISFLDVVGSWDPSLLFVMGGALGVHIFTYRFIIKRRTPLFDSNFHIPAKNKADPWLVVGSALFGIGWGLGGFCPGPALVSLASFQLPVLAFTGAMLGGMFVAMKIRK